MSNNNSVSTSSQSFEELSESLERVSDLQDLLSDAVMDVLEDVEQAEDELESLREEVEQERVELERELQRLTESDVDGDLLRSFVEKPYTLVPRGENESWVIVPRWVPFNVGYLEKQDESYNHFVVNKYVNWISELPEEIQESVGIEREFETAEVEGSVVEFSDSEERDRAWESLGGRDGGLYQRKNEDEIKIKSGKEFDVIAELIDRGNLPFSSSPIQGGDLRDDFENVELRSYQERAWERFKETGMIGVYWPPGTGKTFLALYAGDRLRGKKLIVVPQKTLEEQWEERINEFCEYPEEWDIRTYQYLTYRDNMEEYNQENLVFTVFDECHTLPSSTFSKLSTLNTNYRMGLSASPYREDGRSISAESDVLIRVNGDILRMSMEEVYKKYRTEDIEVLSFYDGSVSWEEANDITRHRADTTIKRIKTQSGRTVDVTSDHSIMVIDNDFSIIEKKPDELTTEDVCLTPMSIPGASTETPVEQDKKWAYILGWYIADGSMTADESGYYVKFSMNGEEKEKIESLKAALYHFTGHVSEYSDKGKGVSLVVSRKRFYETLSEYVNPEWTSHTKRVPQQVFNMTVEEIESFLDGYYQGDAGVTVNKDLSSDILYLKSLVGKFSNRSFSLSKGECKFENHTINQECLRYVVSEAKDDSTFKRFPRRLLNNGLSPVLTEKRGGSKNTVNSVNVENIKSVMGEESIERLKLLSIVSKGGANSKTVASELEKKEGTAQAYLRLQKDRGLIEKTSNSGRNSPALWELTDRGREVLLNYRRCIDLLEGEFGFVKVKEVSEIDYDYEYVYDFNVPSSQTFVAGDGGILCHNTDYIFALTGYPVGLNWDEFVELGVTEYPDVRVYLHRTQRQKAETAEELAQDPGKMVFFCDEIDAGKKLAEKLGVPFVYGETTERLEKFRNNRVIVSSRVGDEGMSLPNVSRVVEFSFHGGSRRQEIQRAGRVMHNDTDGEAGEHIVLMTDEEYEKFGNRLFSLEEKGFNIEYIRQA